MAEDTLPGTPEKDSIDDLTIKSNANVISKPLLRLKLLDSLRQGDFEGLRQLVESGDFQPFENPSVQEVVQLTLHYAVQVAPFSLVRDIVMNWCDSLSDGSDGKPIDSATTFKLDINKQDSDGNTPLHIAALQSRGDVVQLFLSHRKINDCIINNSHLQPIEMCKNLNIAQLMQISRANYVAEIAHEFRLAFNNRDFAHLESILSNSRNAELLDINGNDPETGDTVLHEFVKKRDVMMCRWILDHGGDPFKRDKRGRLPISFLGKVPVEKDLASSETKSALDTEIKQLLEKAAREQSVIDVTNNLHEPPSYKGYLRKWTNFAQGYKLRWFILSSDGTLSYYKDQDDTVNACRGSLNMSTCYLHLDSSERLKFEIIGGSNGAIRWHLKGNHPIETNKWVWAIQSAIRTAKDREVVGYGDNSHHHYHHHTNPKNHTSNNNKNNNDTTSNQSINNTHVNVEITAPVAMSNYSTNQNFSSSAFTLPTSSADAQQQLSQPSPQQQSDSAATKPSPIASTKVAPSNSTATHLNDHHKSNQYLQERSFRVRGDSASSVSSESDLELNENLTDTGKQYVVKVKQNKKPSRSASASSSVAHSSIASSHASHKFSKERLVLEEKANGGSATRFLIDKEEDSFDDEEQVQAVINNRRVNTGKSPHVEKYPNVSGQQVDPAYEDEDVKMNYGPYSQELVMLQRSIIIEISTLGELLGDDYPAPLVMGTAKKSLSTISKNFYQLNSLTDKRDQKLVKMLAKQKDINNLWIQSVKELEIELVEKTEKMAAMDKDKRNLKKLLQKKMTEANYASETVSQSEGAGSQEIATINDPARQIAEIVEFIESRQSSTEEDSDIDEFFDAEDLDEEDQPEDNYDATNADTTSNEGASDILNRSEIKNIDNGIDPPDRTYTKGSEEDTAVNNEQISSDQGDMLSHGSLTESFKATTDEKILDEKTAEAIGHELDAVVETSANLLAESTELKETLEVVKPCNIVPITESQKSKLKVLEDEGTFLGYEEPPRRKLALEKDERPKMNLWTVLKSMIGKDMTKMSLPVTFNEPTSLLQRVAEDLEYADILDRAVIFDDSTLRLLHVAAFISSSYASTIRRVAKPFNPILGETFEYARPDKNYRFFTEQVSHHPPISATWTESPKWDFFGESHVDSKFYGRSFEVKHLGLWHLRLRPDSNDEEELYTWKKPENSVIGILVGNPEVDNHGDVTITNHTTGDYCLLHFKARGWRSANAYEVRGEVYDRNQNKKWVLGGHWNEAIYGKCVSKQADELTLEKSAAPTTATKRSSTASMNVNTEGQKFLLWHVYERPVSPFNLTYFAISLNALQPKLLPWLSPTDTRFRPDQRAMEDGRYDEASDEKRRVEEKQRAARRLRESNNITYKPKWFVKKIHPTTGQPYWQYTGEYWKLRKNHQLKDAGDIF